MIIKDEWFSIPDEETFIINKYPSKYEIKNSLLEVAIDQATMIIEYCKEHKKIPLVFLSGGIDSCLTAYAMKQAGEKTQYSSTYVFFKYFYKHHDTGQLDYNTEDHFYAKSFADTHNIKLQVYDLHINGPAEFIKILTDVGMPNNPTGIGNALYTTVVNKLMTEQGEEYIPINSCGNFSFYNKNLISKGLLPHPGGHHLRGKIDNEINFPYFTPILFQYYERLHRNTLEYQFPMRFYAKNITYSETDWPLRSKGTSVEHIFGGEKRQTLRSKPTLYIYNDHAMYNEDMTLDHLLEQAGWSEYEITNFNEIRDEARSVEIQQKCIVELYSFNSDLDPMYK